MSSQPTSIPRHILLSSSPFPTPHSTSPLPTRLSSPSVSYHFASDPPFSPLDPLPPAGSAHRPHDHQRVIVWDASTGETTSLSSECVANGVRKHGEGGDEVWVVDVQEGPSAAELTTGEGDQARLSIEQLLVVLKQQEDLIAKITQEQDEKNKLAG